MDIQPLTGILSGIGSGSEWDQQRQFRQLIEQWPTLVGDSVAQHSCPLEILNGVLQVATSTAVWAQNLSFERRRILKKLNQRSQFQVLNLKDIRFSTAQWHNRPGSSGAIAVDTRLNSHQQQLQWQQHPSRLPALKQNTDAAAPVEPAPSAAEAFAHWAYRRQQQVSQVPACPQCKSPSPAGELQRWGVCAFCMTRHWQEEKRATQPNGLTEADSWKAKAQAEKAAAKHEADEKASRRSLRGNVAARSLSEPAPSRRLAQKLLLQGSLPQQSTPPATASQPSSAGSNENLASGHQKPVKRRS